MEARTAVRPYDLVIVDDHDAHPAWSHLPPLRFSIPARSGAAIVTSDEKA